MRVSDDRQWNIWQTSITRLHNILALWHGAVVFEPSRRCQMHAPSCCTAPGGSGRERSTCTYAAVMNSHVLGMVQVSSCMRHPAELHSD